MKLEKIQQSQHKVFAEKVYIQSFPEDERRDFSSIYKILKEEKGVFDFFVIIDDEYQNGPIGILSYWNFKKYIYIEHIAIEESFRGNGYGSIVFEMLSNIIQVPIILEVEPPDNDYSKQRIKFYKGLNFTLIDKEYIQPPYSKDKNYIELKLMTNDISLFNIISFDDIVKELYYRVYKVKEKN